MKYLRLKNIVDNWKVMDDDNFISNNKVKIFSHEQILSRDGIDVFHINEGAFLKKIIKFKIIHSVIYSVKILFLLKGKDVFLLNGSHGVLWIMISVVNRVIFNSKKNIICWDVFVEVDCKIKKKIIKFAAKGISIFILWSRDQIFYHSQFLNIDKNKFVFLPYKANHSRFNRYNIEIGNYIFSGGNSKRDYDCLFNAVRNTDIPVIISTTDKKYLDFVERLPNVVVLSASEPAFAQLQAFSKFIVVPMKFTGLKGGGEANFCNAMWHGKPVIASDNISAKDYIIDGVTGYVVNSGDYEELREKILLLWNNENEVKRMGKSAREHVENNFTHELFMRRLLRFSNIFGSHFVSSE